MIIENEAAVTTAVIEAFSRTENPRSREILLALVRHLHGFVREVRLTEAEFHEAIRLVAALGQHTTAWHNEAMLMSGSLGVSALVCLLNNGNGGGLGLLEKQAIAVAAAGAWAAVVTFALLKAIDRVTGLRVDQETEHDGLDGALHGESAYGSPGGVAHGS